MFICTAGVYSGNALLLAWPSENLMGHTFRATGLAIVIMIGDLGAIIGTEVYRMPLGSLANKNFKYSHILAIIWLVIGTSSAAALYLGLSRQNARWDQAEAQSGQQQHSVEVEKSSEVVDEKIKAWQRSYRYQL
jgi:uncharacterized phage-associated protein